MESEVYQVLVDPSADRRLAHHAEFISRVSESAAVRLYEAYEEALRFLEYSPKSCPPYFPYAPIDAELRFKLFGKRYRLVFEIDGTTVYVYDIQDCRQNSDKNLI